jgi:CDP-glycerol glycerophosphotransferase (TagB/SpsB family)
VLSQVRRKLRPRTRARKLSVELKRRRRTAAYVSARRTPLAERTVMYEAFFGNGVLDNPEAIFRHLLTQPDMQDLEHVWTLDDPAKHQTVVREFAGNPRVRFVKGDSPDYWRAMATAKYLVNNQTFPQLFAKRPGQVYLNTWHGVPLKHMGLDMAGIHKAHPRNIIRNMLNADFLVSASDYMTTTMYRRAYRLQGLFPGTVLEMGQPRMDFLTAAAADPASSNDSGPWA